MSPVSKFGMSTVRPRTADRLREVRRVLRRVRATLQPGSAPTERPRPRVRIETTRAVPAWALRLLLLAVGAVCVVVIGQSVVSQVILTGALLVVVAMPGGVSAGVFAVMVGLSLLAFDPGTPSAGLPVSADAVVLLAAVHLIAVLGSVLGQVPLRTTVELRALLPTARRYVIIQATAQLLALVAGWLSEREVVVTALPVLALLALMGGATWLLPRLHRSP